MRIATLFFIFSILTPLVAGVECGNERSMQSYALQSAVMQNHALQLDDAVSLKELKTSQGYAYLFYFRMRPGSANAYTLLVTLDGQCNLRYVQKTPTVSDLLFVRN